MKVSIVTAVLNGGKVVADTLQSVASQDYPDIEHIVVDGASQDNTLQIVNDHADQLAKIVSAPDKGVYDALNRGIELATGDIVMCLHAGDVYEHSGVVSRVVREFADPAVQLTFAELVMTSSADRSDVRRHYSTPKFKVSDFAAGLMPAHPTVAARRSVFQSLGSYDPNYRIAGDFEFLVRALLVHGIVFRNIPEILIRMPLGGLSNRRWWVPIFTTFELRRACRQHGVATNWFKLLYRVVVKWRTSVRRSSAAQG